MPIDLVVDERDTASTSGAGALSGISKSAMSPGAYHPGHIAGDITGSHDQVTRLIVLSHIHHRVRYIKLYAAILFNSTTVDANLRAVVVI